MKRLTACLLSAAFLAGATAASAQTTFRLGLRGGLNRALTTTDPASNRSNLPASELRNDKSALFAWQAGVAFEARFGKLALQPALVFSQKGNKFHTASYVGGFLGSASQEATGTTRTNWLELPLNAVYTLHGGHGLQVFAGPYLALAVGGRYQGTTYRSNPYAKFAPQEFGGQIAYGAGTANHRLDVGMNFGVGYRQGPLQVQLSYVLGLRNLYQTTEPMLGGSNGFAYDRLYNETAYNRGAQLTGTYFFSL